MADELVEALEQSAVKFDSGKRVSWLDKLFAVRTMREAAARIQSDAAEIARLRARLEIPEPPFDTEQCDGIACRDQTIRQQDKQIARLRAEVAARERPDFASCPTCHQYSHTIAGGLVEEAALFFTAMIDGRQYRFDEQTRDMAQRLIAALSTT